MRGLRIFVVVAATCAGCTAEPEIETLRMSYPHELVTMDPQAHSDTVTRTVFSAVYEGLVVFEPGLPVRPGLADRWTTPDNNTWHLHVREGVRFHDGSVLTPADAVASIDRARSSRVAGHQLDEISGVRELPGEGRLIEITTTEPAPLLLTRLESVPVVPIGFDPEVPVGTGPYRWQSGSVQGPILLRRWEDYWAEPADYPEVNIRFVPYQEDVATLLHQGRLDVVASVSSTYLRDHLSIEHWRVIASPSVGITYLGLNSSIPGLADIRVRQAIDLAIDRPQMVASIFAEGAARPAYSLVSPEVFGYSPKHPRAILDRDEARRLLAAAGGLPATPLKLAYAEKYAPVAEEILSDLESIGVGVEGELLPYEAFYRRLEEASSDLFLFTWNFRAADASRFLDAFVRTRNSTTGYGRLNGAAFSDSDIDALIETAVIEPRSNLRLEKLQEAVLRVGEKFIYLPLYKPSNLSLLRDGVVARNRGQPMLRPQDLRPAG